MLFFAALLKDVKFAQYILNGIIVGACKFALHPGKTKGVPSGIGMIVGSGAKVTVFPFSSVLPACQ